VFSRPMFQILTVLVMLLWTTCLMMVIFVGKPDVCSPDVIIMLRRRFYNCSMSVKLVLFKSFCLCLYKIALWNRFSIGLMNKFRSCYINCTKMFLGFTKYYSVTNMLLLTGLPSFDTLMHNARKSDAARWNVNSNVSVKSLLVV